jgi:hypothetical protein
MPFDFGYPVHALWFWLSCLFPLAILFMPFDFVYARVASIAAWIAEEGLEDCV